MLEKKYEKASFLSFILLISIIFKFNIEKIFSDKYFYDSKKVFNLAIGKSEVSDSSFDFTASVYRGFIDFLNINDYILFNALIGVVLNILLFIYLLKTEYVKKNNIYFYGFIFASSLFLNIYIFIISKDLIQFGIYTLVFIILSCDNIKDKIKLILISIIFIYFSVVFREYLIGVLGFFLIILSTILKNDKISILSIVKFFLVVFVGLFLFKILFNEKYIEMVNIRSTINKYRIGNLDAVTIIYDLINNNKDNVFVFILNTSINFIRMIFPIELLLIGKKYIPFVVYQVIISIGFIKKLKIKNKNYKVNTMLSIVMAYYIVASIFEPDFGSLLKHQMSIYIPIQYILFRGGDCLSKG